jgi:hypothetical protein
MKTCARCKQEKELTDFRVDKTASCGYRSYCFSCDKIRTKEAGRMRYKNGKRKIYNKENADVISSKYKKWRLDNLASISKKASERYNTDPEYKLKHILRVRIQKALKLGCKNTSSKELLGCSISEYKSYLESKFTKGMSWENYGRKGWHIDHIIPCSSFNLLDIEQQKQCFHYTNTQPLWWEDNLKKHNKLCV